MSISPDRIDVYQDIQENYIVYDREITENPDPKFNNNLLVTNDHLSNRLYFNMWYTFDDRDLESKEISIVWINANNEKGFSLCTDKQLNDENRLTFAWNVPHQATYKEGIVYFAIRIVANDYIWNSLPRTVEIKKGLVTTEYNSLDEAGYPPGWVDYIEGKYKLNLEKLTETEYDNLETKSDSTVYIVLKNDDTISQYLGDKQISGGGGSSTESAVSWGIIDAPDNWLQITQTDTNKANITVLQGTEFRYPMGRDENGSRIYGTYKTTSPVTTSNFGRPGTTYVLLNNQGSFKDLSCNQYIITHDKNVWNTYITKEDAFTQAIIYDYVDNKFYIGKKNSSTGVYTTTEFEGIVAGYLKQQYYNGSTSGYYTIVESGTIARKLVDIHSEDLLNIINSKPGLIINGAYMNTSIGPLNTVNSVLWDDTHTNQVAGTHNNVFGSNNAAIGGEYTTVFGYNNTIKSNTPTDYGTRCCLVSGRNNTIVGGTIQESTILGTSNNISLNADDYMQYCLVSGQNIKLMSNSSSHSSQYINSIFSGRNYSIDGYVTNSVIMADSLECGVSNNKYVSVDNSLVLGNKNALKSLVYNTSQVADTTYLYHSIITGTNNTLPTSEYCLVMGQTNSLNNYSSMRNVLCIGVRITAPEQYDHTLQNSILYGTGITLKQDCTYSLLGGSNNEISNAHSSLVIGSGVKLKGTNNDECITVGSYITIQGQCLQTALFGYSINATGDVNHSIIGGSGNTFSKDVNNSSIVGSSIKTLEYADYINCMGSSITFNKSVSYSNITAHSCTINNALQDCIICAGSSVINMQSTTEGGSVNLNGCTMLGQYLQADNTDLLSVEGYNPGNSQTFSIFGKYNKYEDAIFMVGNGTSDINRKNAMVIDHDNNMTVSGTIKATTSEGVIVDLLAKIQELENRIQQLENA